MAKASRGLLGYCGHAAAAGLALGFVLLASHGAQAQDVPKVELRPGVFFEVVELKRVRKDISGLTFEIDNTSPDTVTLAQLGIKTERSLEVSLGQIVLADSIMCKRTRAISLGVIGVQLDG